MLKRGDSLYQALRRIIIDSRIFAGYKNKADLTIINDNKNKTISAIKHIISEFEDTLSKIKNRGEITDIIS